MRLFYFSAMSVIGLLARNNMVVVASDKPITAVETLGNPVHLHHEVVESGLVRSLRTREKDIQDSTVAKDDAIKVEEDRSSLIQTINTPRYAYWFSQQMTPLDVRRELHLPAHKLQAKPSKVYSGYVEYYNIHCSFFKYRDEPFCCVKEY
uniref:Secreted RxLR effector protein 17 n=1 Tax=Plasmopara viticola TaxID=143451 RepID=RLR17_PLAVT|nr:RecName: Full=Secreted RxLR effector protein 17; Flags: Precursor [Plasmopara viticola]ANC73373.1 secreted RxLR effector peptide protein 17 [Plasmopara viticola]